MMSRPANTARDRTASRRGASKTEVGTRTVCSPYPADILTDRGCPRFGEYSMKAVLARVFSAWHRGRRCWPLLLVAPLGGVGCARTSATSGDVAPGLERAAADSRDPRVGLRAGLMDAEEAVWNLRVLSKTPPPPDFIGVTNSDLAFTGRYAIQGNYNGFQVWDISNPRKPALKTGFVCPASQSDVSVYK